MNVVTTNARLLGWTATITAWMLFGTTYWVTQRFLPADAPLWGSTLRALPAGIALLLLARRLPTGAWWWKAAVLGSLNMGLFFLLLYIAAQRLPSSVATSIGAISPLMLAGVAWLLIGERVNTWFLGGAVLGVVGVVLIVGMAQSAIDAWGVAASLGATALLSLGAILGKRWNDGTPVLTTTAWQLMIGGLELLVVAIFVEGAPPVIRGSAIVAFAYISLIATAFSYVCLFTGFKHLSAGTVGMLGLLNPITGVLVGLLLASESLTAAQTTGIALVLVSIVLSQRRKTS